jgi:hypothetical protein
MTELNFYYVNKRAQLTVHNAVETTPIVRPLAGHLLEGNPNAHVSTPPVFETGAALELYIYSIHLLKPLEINCSVELKKKIHYVYLSAYHAIITGKFLSK